MGDIIKKNARNLPDVHFAAPYGNAVELDFQFKTDASGVCDSDQATAVADGDVVILGVLPSGMGLKDMRAQVSNVFQTACAAAVGFRYVDGVDSTTVPQDDDFFAAAVALDALGITRKTNYAAPPVVLPKAAYLILTNTTTHDEAGQLDIAIQGVLTGADS